MCSGLSPYKRRVKSSQRVQKDEELDDRTGRTRRRPVGVRRLKLGEREIVAQGLRAAVFQDLYHHFMTVSWPRLFATIAAFS